MSDKVYGLSSVTSAQMAKLASRCCQIIFSGTVRSPEEVPSSECPAGLQHRTCSCHGSGLEKLPFRGNGAPVGGRSHGPGQGKAGKPQPRAGS